jgi:predicted ATPase
LKPLTLDSINELVRSVFTEDSAKELSERLYFETDGNPFFIVEYLKAVENDQPGGLSKAWRIPGSVRDLLRSRLSSLQETAWQIIQTAAVMGRSFNFTVLRSASGRSEEETVEALEDLIQRGLVREIQSLEDHSGGRPFQPEYDFSHQWIRQLVYEETSSARRRILHRRVAESLVAQAREGREPDSLAGVVAQHFRLANQSKEAASYFRLAGEYARSLYANTEAIAHFTAALELGYPHPAGIHESIGDLLTLSGEYAKAYFSYQEAIDLYEGYTQAIARVEHKLGIVYERHGEWDLAEAHFMRALDCLGEGAVTGEAARIYADRSLGAYHRGQLNQALELARRALAIAGEAGDKLALAQAYNILGILARSEEDYPLARSSLEQSLLLAEALNDPAARAAALNNLALVYGSEGNIEKALELTQMALKLSSSQGDRHREAALHNNLADLYYQKGQSDTAMMHLKQAVTLFSEIDKRVLSDPTKARSSEVTRTERQYQPEIWKLSEW